MPPPTAHAGPWQPPTPPHTRRPMRPKPAGCGEGQGRAGGGRSVGLQPLGSPIEPHRSLPAPLTVDAELDGGHGGRWAAAIKGRKRAGAGATPGLVPPPPARCPSARCGMRERAGLDQWPDASLWAVQSSCTQPQHCAVHRSMHSLQTNRRRRMHADLQTPSAGSHVPVRLPVPLLLPTHPRLREPISPGTAGRQQRSVSDQ